MSAGASRWELSAPIRYPDPDIVVLDPRFRPWWADVRDRTPRDGLSLHRGPAYYGDGRYLLFSDIPNDALLRWDEITGAVATLRHPAAIPTAIPGTVRAGFPASSAAARLTPELDGTITVLASHFEGTRLTGPTTWW